MQTIDSLSEQTDTSLGTDEPLSMPPDSTDRSKRKAMENHMLVERRSPMYIQLYAVLDDPNKSERDDCTQFVMDASKDTLDDAIDFLSNDVAPELWGVSHVTLVGIVPLSTWENRSVRTRKVLSTLLLKRVFALNHQDCLVVTPDKAHDPIVTMEDSNEDMGRGINILNKDETTDPVRRAIVVDALIVDTGDDLIAEGIPGRDESRELGDEEDNAETKLAEAESEDDNSCDRFPAVLCDKHGEVAVANMEGAASASIPESRTEKGIPDSENKEESFSSVKNLIAKFSTSPATKYEENVESEGFPAVLWEIRDFRGFSGCPRDKKEDTVDAAGAISAPQETSEEGGPFETEEGSPFKTDKSNGEKNDNEKPTAPIEGAQSTVPQPKQEKDDVTIIRSGVPAGPSKRQSTGDQAEKNYAISNGANGGDGNFEHHDGDATEKDDSTADVETVRGLNTFGIAAESAVASSAAARSLSDNEDNKETDVRLSTRSVASPASVEMTDDKNGTNERKSNDNNSGAETKATVVGTDENVVKVPAPERKATDELAEDFFQREPRQMLTVASNEDFSRGDLSGLSSKDDSNQYDYIGLSDKAADFPVTDDVMSAASSYDNVVVVDLHGSEHGKALHGSEHGKDLHGAEDGEKVAVNGDEHGEKKRDYGESADINDDSWRTEQNLEDSNELLFASTTESEQEATDLDASATLPSLLGNRDVDELAPLVDDLRPKLDGAPQAVARHSTRSPSSLYKIGTTYFLLRERDGIEYPVKILSLGKSGTTCIIEYEHHRTKKKVSTSKLLPDTPKRRQKFEEKVKSGQIDNDPPARIAKEIEQRKLEELRHHISRHNLPKCSIEGTLIKEPSRRVYFAKDRETVNHIAKKFNVPSERIVYDNQSAYPSLKKSSHLRPLTSIVLPP